MALESTVSFPLSCGLGGLSFPIYLLPPMVYLWPRHFIHSEPMQLVRLTTEGLLFSNAYNERYNESILDIVDIIGPGMRLKLRRFKNLLVTVRLHWSQFNSLFGQKTPVQMDGSIYLLILKKRPTTR